MIWAVFMRRYCDGIGSSVACNHGLWVTEIAQQGCSTDAHTWKTRKEMACMSHSIIGNCLQRKEKERTTEQVKMVIVVGKKLFSQSTRYGAVSSYKRSFQYVNQSGHECSDYQIAASSCTNLHDDGNLWAWILSLILNFENRKAPGFLCTNRFAATPATNANSWYLEQYKTFV